MTKEEFAILLNGREYGEEISSDEERVAKANGLVVVFGYSDDNVEFRGAINDEVGAFQGTTVNIDAKGVIPECDCQCECRKCQSEYPTARLIEAKWSSGDYAWFIDTSIPHASFEILEGEEKFCRGIVFNISDL